MLSRKTLQDLLTFEAGPQEVLSVILELDGAQGRRRAPSALAKELLGATPTPGLEKDREAVERFLAGFEPKGCRGLALFSSQKRGLWAACPLPEPSKSRLRVGDRPYLEPLLSIIEPYRRFGILLLSGKKARFLEAYLGEIEELPGPPPGQDRLPLGIMLSEERERAFKAAADHFMRLTRERGFERIILAAPKELESSFINHLHGYLQNNLILDASIDPAAKPLEVLESIKTGEQESRKVRESVLVHRLQDAVRSGGMGVAGLFDTLNALHAGQIRLLLVRDGFTKLGRRCPACGRLGMGGKRCLACYSDTEPVLDLVGEMAALALDSRCEVFRILHEQRLDNLGGIGAELKFKVAAPAAKGAAAR